MISATFPASAGERGDVAQLVEHLLCKQGVVGSSPIVSTRGAKRGWPSQRLLSDGMDTADFEALCETTYEPVANAAFLIVGDRQEALDITQEAFSRALERWPQVRAMNNPQGWIYRVAVNLALSRNRGLRRLSNRVPDRGAPGPEPTDPALTAALMRLTPAQRTAIVLRFYLDLSIDDTATALRKRPGTVRALTAQGIARLRRDFGPEWLEEDDEQIVP